METGPLPGLLPLNPEIMSTTTKSIDLLEELPPIPNKDYRPELIRALASVVDCIIVLDDDPTGTQTVHHTPVLTEWTVPAIQAEFERGTDLFYILTNSRSLTETRAVQLAGEVGGNIKTAAGNTRTRFWVISRSDSTLRGHYPAEVTALEESLNLNAGIHFIIPAFFEGGRFTIDDIHYVQQDQQLIPAAETPYARDPVFGYKHSDLKLWVSEKTRGKVSSGQVGSIGIKELRSGTIDQLIRKLARMVPGSHCVVNAAAYSDLVFFGLALIKSGVRPVFRTAASLVAALACQPPKSLLTGDELTLNNENGGLIVAGSFVSTTTDQLNHLFQHRPDLVQVELSVSQLLESPADHYAQGLTSRLDEVLRTGRSAVLFTSRKLITDSSGEKNQLIGQKVSECLTDVVKALGTTPKFLISKGGITSSDVATRSMGAKRAMVRGQVIMGVPVWQLGGESKFPGLHQIIFPGNVGDQQSLTQVVNMLQPPVQNK